MSSNQRIRWVDLPVRVRRGVEEILGDRVTHAVSQTGGFTAGSADRVRTAGGGRAFVKAVSPAQNAHSTTLHRREAWVTAALPPDAPAPRLLDCYDDGEWVALVLEDIAGRHPATPWVAEELRCVVAALERLARARPPVDLPSASETLVDLFGGWRRIAANPPGDLPLWARQRLDQLCALADRGLGALTGDSLVHRDVRADNILLGPEGSVTLVDWPWACRGPAWLDTLLLLMHVRMAGGHDTRTLLARAEAVADPDDLLAVVAGFAGYYLDRSRQPPPRSIPTVRAFQRAQAGSALAWLWENLQRLG